MAPTLNAETLAGVPSSAPARRILLFLIVALLAGANLPWHLDNYDQAKQAWVSYEIAKGGDPLFQHTPRGRVATKPPLAGWMSLAVYQLTGWWDLAWRLAAFLPAIALLWLLAREGSRLWPEGGELLTACAFALNLFTPRLATLVRTDMLLTLWITLCGLMMFRKVVARTGWSTGERLAFAAAMTAALLTKGPILHAFLLPGLVAYLLLAPKGARHFVWSGWWTWVVPMGIFVAWGVAGLLTRPDFYNEVVVEEFFSRFDQSLKSHERQQPLWFYFPHLLHKFLPWSVLLLGIACFSRNARRAIRDNPALLWLACWALGGLLLMTFVPSKRVDRIYPVIPPLCLLLTGMVAACQCGTRVRSWCGAAIIASALLASGYFLTVVAIGYRDGSDGLVHFGRTAAAVGGPDLAVIGGRDEGLFLYTAVAGPIHPREAVQLWQEGKLTSLVIPRRRLEEENISRIRPLPDPILESGLRPSGESYLLFLHPAAQPKSGEDGPPGM